MVSKSKSIAIVMRAHADQVRWFTNEPYYNHPLRVASHVQLISEDDDVVHAAFLHDVIEDTVWTDQDLRREGYSERTLELLDLLSHREGETYGDSILRISQDPDAVTIKQADLSDNLATLPAGHKLAERYINALCTLHGVKR